MSFIASKYHVLAQKSISDNKNKDKIFSDKHFSVEVLLKLFSNCDHPEKWVLLLKNIIIWLYKAFQTIKAGTKYFLPKFFYGNFVDVVQQSWPKDKRVLILDYVIFRLNKVYQRRFNGSYITKFLQSKRMLIFCFYMVYKC